MPSLIRERSFYKHMAALVLPVALQNMITTSMGIIDTIMLGSLGDATLSGASLGNQASFMLMVICFGFTTGGVVLMSQYRGRGNKEVLGRIMALSLRTVAMLSVIFTVVCALFPTWLLSLLTNEPEVISQGSKYLGTVCFSYLPANLVSSYLISMRAHEKAGMTTIIYSISVGINIFFNYCLIYGKLGFPQMGITGAALGTVIARCCELVMCLIYIKFFDKVSGFRFKTLFRHETTLMSDYFRHAIPITGSELVWCLGSVVTAAIIGHIGSVFVAANSIVSMVNELGMVMLFGISSATSVNIGAAVGRGDIKYAKQIGATMMAIGTAVGIVAGALVLLLREPIISLYDISDAAKDAARSIMYVTAGNLMLVGFESTCGMGVLRGGGDNKFVFLCDILAMWCVCVPLGYLSGLVWKLPVIFVYLLMRCETLTRMALYIARLCSGKYFRNLTRENI